jgi:hypothetical protein
MPHDRSISEFADTRVAAKEILPNGTAALIGTSLRSVLADAFAYISKPRTFIVIICPVLAVGAITRCSMNKESRSTR